LRGRAQGSAEAHVFFPANAELVFQFLPGGIQFEKIGDKKGDSELNLKSEAKAKGKAILPKSLVNFISGCRYRGSFGHVSYLLKLKNYRKRYSEANETAPDSTIVLPTDCRILIPPDARDAFEHFGWKDPDMVDEFVGFMKLASSRKILWDVGALFGVFSLAFALKGTGRRALAFEPNPISRAKFEECLNLNPTAKVEVFDFAVGLRDEVVEFERGFHYTAVAGLSARPTEENLIQRKTLSIDELIERNLDPPDMIKIDVEGHELEVLQGAEKLLLANKPLLSIELHPNLLIRKGTSAPAIAQYLEKAGYVFHNTQLKRVKKSFFERQDNFRIFAM
jgi:FkbM family methyltransferase